MARTEMISYDEAKNHAFDTVLHRQSSKSTGGIKSMVGKNSAAYNAASKEYFHHWDEKKAEDETEADRKDRADDYASLTRQ